MTVRSKSTACFAMLDQLARVAFEPICRRVLVNDSSDFTSVIDQWASKAWPALSDMWYRTRQSDATRRWFMEFA
eukprot:3129904-Pyramimonas_sp.AAC.1